MSTPETKPEDEQFAAAPCYAPLRWSAEKPKRSGWWWWEAKHTMPGGRTIFSRGIDEVYFWGGRKQLWVNHGNSSLALKNHPAGQWAGPLPEPLEPSDVKPEHNDPS